MNESEAKPEAQRKNNSFKQEFDKELSKNWLRNKLISSKEKFNGLKFVPPKNTQN